MLVFVTGICGQLGYDVVNEASVRGCQVVGSDIHSSHYGGADRSAVTQVPYVQLDITDTHSVTSVITHIHPDVIIHCAAWTAVDAAEEDENRSKVYTINAIGTENIARAAKSIGAKLIYISTDYVFDG